MLYKGPFTFGKMLLALRVAKGATPEQVSRATGVKVSVITRAERDLLVPPASALLALAWYYGTDAMLLTRRAAKQRAAWDGDDHARGRPPYDFLRGAPARVGAPSAAQRADARGRRRFLVLEGSGPEGAQSASGRGAPRLTVVHT